MRFIGVMVIALIATFPMTGMAQTIKNVSPKELANNHARYKGETIRLKGINCVDPIKGGFRCIANTGGRVLRIDAGFLGPRTTGEIAQHIIEECKGTANITRSECKFNIEITPANSIKETMDTDGGSMEVVLIYSAGIEMDR